MGRGEAIAHLTDLQFRFIRRILTPIANMEDDQFTRVHSVIDKIGIASDREDANTDNVGLPPKAGPGYRASSSLVERICRTTAVAAPTLCCAMYW